jgi:hypothetical protein
MPAKSRRATKICCNRETAARNCSKQTATRAWPRLPSPLCPGKSRGHSLPAQPGSDTPPAVRRKRGLTQIIQHVAKRTLAFRGCHTHFMVIPAWPAGGRRPPRRMGRSKRTCGHPHILRTIPASGRRGTRHGPSPQVLAPTQPGYATNVLNQIPQRGEMLRRKRQDPPENFNYYAVSSRKV